MAPIMGGLKNLYNIRDWWFDRIVSYLMFGEWKVVIKNFKESKSKREKALLGMTDPDTNTIFLDLKYGTPRILVHEMGHVIFGDLLDEEARNKPKNLLKGLRGSQKFERWSELRILEWEKCFAESLSAEQRKILQFFIDEAMIEYEKGR